MSELRHSIRVASKRTGLSPHVIRIWEKRYGAVTPSRTGSNRRQFSDEEIERLGLLRQATLAGQSICHAAQLTTDQLRALAGERPPGSTTRPCDRPPAAAKRLVAEALMAVQQLDSPKLERVLERAVMAFGQHGLLEKVITPLAVAIGDLWKAGTIMAANEHLASGTLRSFLDRMARPFAMNGANPALVVGTPAGQLHELGAVMAAAAAADLGWRVTYLGCSLPAAEIAGAAVQSKARAVALSIVYPGDDPELPKELETLRRLLPRRIGILAGGRVAASYHDTLQKIGAIECGDLKHFYRCLEVLRRPV